MLPSFVWDSSIPYSIPSKQDQAALWNSYRNEYSKRRLTDPRDKTKAIAGIAQILQEIHKDEYLIEVGMFRNTIRHQLAWHLDSWTLRKRDRRTEDIVRTPGIPTWSWASINGPIDEVHMAEVDVEVIDDGNTKALNELRQGILRLHAKIIRTGTIETRLREDWRVDFDNASSDDAFRAEYWFLLLGYDTGLSYSIGLVVTPTSFGSQEWQRIGWFYENFGVNSKNPRTSIWLEPGVKPQAAILR
jgi:hypothetical protein